MPVHTVSRNETLFTIARQHGFRSWRAIYEHPNNERLRELRPDPMVLAPGDAVFVPDKEPSEFQNATGRSHRFRLHAPKCFVSVYLQDETGVPYGGCKYELKLAGQSFQGVTSDTGLVSHEVGIDVTKAELTLWIDPDDSAAISQWTLQIGALDPIDTVSGVQSRLNNLGYQAGEVTGSMNDASLSLELVPWRELYETMTGKSADDVPAAAGADQTTWVQYKLNELGWFAGKLDGNANDPDLEKAIVRYRQSHPGLYVPLFRISGDPTSNYVYDPANIAINRRIDPDLVGTLQLDTTALPSLDTADVLTGAAAEGKLYVHAERFCQDVAREFVNDDPLATTTIKHDKEREWLSAPRFPLRARLMVTASHGAPVWAPAASQSTQVRWRWQDQAEPTDRQPAAPNTTRAYIERVHAEAGRASFNNARTVVGGQISGNDATDKAVVFDRVVGELTPAAAADAWGVTTSGDLVFFCPSTIAGDNYELEATVGGLVATTGRMTTWRRIRVAGHVSWGGDPTDVWADVARKYALAYVEIVAPEQSTMADTIRNKPSLQAAFRRASKQDRWSDDAWLPEPLPDDLFVSGTATTTQAMRQRLEDALNGTDGAYDGWRNDIDIAARYLAAKKIIDGWKRGDDDELAPRPAPTAPRTSDPLLVRGWEHYWNELNRLIETTDKPEPANLKGLKLIGWRKSANAIDARFRDLPANQRRIVDWDPQAALSKLYRSKVAVFLERFIGRTQQAVLLELEQLLTPGLIVLEFAAHLPRNGFELDLSYGSQMIGGGKVLVNRGAYRNYRESHLFTHEVAHGLFLKHDKNAQAQVELDHDQSDDNCVMSYVYDPDSPPPPSCKTVDRPHYRPGRFDPEFCGKCNLKLRGWNIRAGNLPAQSA